MRISASRLGFCLALAVLAAALADPLVEFGTNAGWFGAGTLTDHSNLDVVPALLLGAGLLALYLVRKARAILADMAPDRGVALLPAIFTLQLLTLYAMETCEQLVVCGHVLSASAWLGGPLPVSVAVHGVLCIAVTLAVVRSKRTLAATTLHVIGLFVRISRGGDIRPPAPASNWFARSCATALLPVPCVIGERAPPR